MGSIITSRLSIGIPGGRHWCRVELEPNWYVQALTLDFVGWRDEVWARANGIIGFHCGVLCDYCGLCAVSFDECYEVMRPIIQCV